MLLRPSALLYRTADWLCRLRRPLRLGVRAIVTAADGHVLLVHHSYLAGWYLPGGGVAKGETAADAVVRELREETGLVAEGTPVLRSLHGSFYHGISDHVAVFTVPQWHGTPKPDGREVVAAVFFSLDALPDETSPATRRRLTEFAAGGPPSPDW